MEGLGGCGLILCDSNVSLSPWAPSTPGTLVQSFTLPVPRDAAPHHQTRGLPIPRRTSEPSRPRSRAQRPPSGQDSPLQQRAPSFCLERALASEMGEWMYLGWPEPGVAGSHGVKKIKPIRKSALPFRMQNIIQVHYRKI